MIVGIGIDLVRVDRLQAALARTPGLARRLFTPAELTGGIASLAACFAAKEALAKALGAPPGLRWADAEIRHEPGGRPRLEVTGSVAVAGDAAGVRHWHLSLSHDAGFAVAVVVAEK